MELARKVMEFQALPHNQASKTRKLEKDCFHASLSWGDGQQPTKEEMTEAAQSFLKAVGLEKARAVFIAHDDTDHAHLHIVASRIDPETGRSLIQQNDFISGQKWAAQWERDHGQERDGSKGKDLLALMDAVDKRDAEAVLSHLTRDNPTFEPWQLKRALAYGNLNDADRKDFTGKFSLIKIASACGRQRIPQFPATRRAKFWPLKWRCCATSKHWPATIARLKRRTDCGDRRRIYVEAGTGRRLAAPYRRGRFCDVVGRGWHRQEPHLERRARRLRGRGFEGYRLGMDE